MLWFCIGLKVALCNQNLLCRFSFAPGHFIISMRSLGRSASKLLSVKIWRGIEFIKVNYYRVGITHEMKLIEQLHLDILNVIKNKLLVESVKQSCKKFTSSLFHINFCLILSFLCFLNSEYEHCWAAFLIL